MPLKEGLVTYVFQEREARPAPPCTTHRKVRGSEAGVWIRPGLKPLGGFPRKGKVGQSKELRVG